MQRDHKKRYIPNKFNIKEQTVFVSKRLIIKNYSKNYDFVPFALPSRYRPVTATAYRDSPSATVTHSYLTVQYRYITVP